MLSRVLSGLISVVTCCAVTAQENWVVGSKWEFSQVDRYGKETRRWERAVTAKEGEDFIHLDGEITSRVSPAGVFTRPMPANRPGTFAYTPIKVPLGEGSEWEYTLHYVGSNMGLPARATFKCKAGALETITVLAGTFSARKFDCRGTFHSEAGSNGPSSSSNWYAPEIGSVVKSIIKWSDQWVREENTVQLLKFSKP